MIPFEKLPIKHIIKLVLFTALVVGIIWTVVFLNGHGRIKITDMDGAEIKEFSYCVCVPVCASMTEVKGSSAILPNSQYTVKVITSDNTSYITNVTVNNFLRTTNITAKSEKFAVSPVLTSSEQNVIPLGSGNFVTFDGSGKGYVTESLPVVPGSIRFAQYVTPQDVAIILDQPRSSDQTQVFIYNTAMKSLQKLGDIPPGEGSLGVYRGGNNLTAIRQEASSATIFTISSTGITSQKIPTTIPISLVGEVPVAVSDSNHIVTLSGNNYVPEGDGDGSRGGSEAKITVYAKPSLTEVKSISVGTRSDISGLSLSPDGKTVIALGDSSLSAYNLETGENIFNSPLDNTGPSSVIWNSDSSFVYQSGINGVYMADLTKKESFSIIDSSLLRVTGVSSIIDGRIYLSAFPNKQGNSERTNPDGYAVNLNKTVSNTENTEEDSIIYSLPHDGLTYSISYHFDDNSKLIIDIYGADGTRNWAIAQLLDIGFDPANYTYEFHDYTSPFLEVGNVR